jgi:MFS family permease
MKENALRNVWLITFANAIGNTWPIRAIIFLYFLANDATVGDYQMVQWAMFWTLLFLELPTGRLSDRWGRKNVLVLGAIAKLIGISFYAAGTNVLWFFIGEQILAIAKSLHSGTLQSALKESLMERGEDESEYRRVESRFIMIRTAFEFVAVFAGGIIAIYSLRATAVISCVMSVVSLCLFLLVKQPSVRQEDKRPTGWESFRKIWNNSTLWSMALFMGLIMAGAQHVLALRQPYALSIGLEKEYFGLMEAGAMLAMIGGAWLAGRTHPHRDRSWIILMGLVLFGGMMLCGFIPVMDSMAIMLLLIATNCIVRGVAEFSRPVINDVLNREDIARERATVLSAGPFISYVLVALTGPLVQWGLEEGWSVPSILTMVGAGGAVFYTGVLLTSSWFWKR